MNKIKKLNNKFINNYKINNEIKKNIYVKIIENGDNYKENIIMNNEKKKYSDLIIKYDAELCTYNKNNNIIKTQTYNSLYLLKINIINIFLTNKAENILYGCVAIDSKYNNLKYAIDIVLLCGNAKYKNIGKILLDYIFKEF